MIEGTHKIIKWWDKKKNIILYGIDIFKGGKWYHVHDGVNPLFFADRNEANKHKRIFNNSLSSNKK